MKSTRREWFAGVGVGVGVSLGGRAIADPFEKPRRDLRIAKVRITPIALPDPPLLFAGGCHGPYFLRNIVEIETTDGIVGVGECSGGVRVTAALQSVAKTLEGKSAFAYRSFAGGGASLLAYAGIETACLDACGKATGVRVCDLLGGPVREDVPFAAYLFYRYAADHPVVLSDPRRVDRGAPGIDDWGEVRTPESMAKMSEAFRDRWGFKVFKLKAGVLPPDRELDTLHALAERLGKAAVLRIDPNSRWKMETALRIGKSMRGLNLEYYEDPVASQADMARVRSETGLRMSTNTCVTSFSHIPEALRLKPVDVVLADHHYWGGLTGCLALNEIAGPAGWALSQHSNNHAGVSMAAMIHLAATTSRLTLASDTHYPWLPEGSDVIAGPKLRIENGKMRIPDGPGLGVELDKDRLAAAHEVYKKCGMTAREDASLMRRLDPTWTRELL